MKCKLFATIFLSCFPLSVFAQSSSIGNTTDYSWSNNLGLENGYCLSGSDSNEFELSMSEQIRIRKLDYVLALVPGAVQMRRDHPAVAASIWGSIAITGGLAIYEHAHMINLQNKSASDSSNSDWYDGKIRNAKKVRNGSLIALGGIYIVNYITALILNDNNPKTKDLHAFVTPNGAVGVTYAINF